MRKLWLIFAQTTTICLGILFVVTTLRPDLLGLSTRATVDVVTTREAAEATGIALSTVKVRLKELLAAGAIETHGRGKAAFYRRK